jgi:hypothetical protein
MGVVILVWAIATIILRATVGPAENALGNSVAMMLDVSFAVGAVVALSLRVVGAFGWPRRFWRM